MGTLLSSSPFITRAMHCLIVCFFVLSLVLQCHTLQYNARKSNFQRLLNLSPELEREPYQVIDIAMEDFIATPIASQPREATMTRKLMRNATVKLSAAVDAHRAQTSRIADVTRKFMAH